MFTEKKHTHTLGIKIQFRHIKFVYTCLNVLHLLYVMLRNAIKATNEKVCLTSYQQKRFYEDGTKSRKKKKEKKVTSFAARFKQLYTTTTSSKNPEKAWCLLYAPTL